MSPARTSRPAAKAAKATKAATPAAASHGVNRHLGHQVRDLRRAKGVTIPQLAARIDRSVGWLSQIERGLSEVSISALHQIAAALEVQVSWFFGQGSTPPASMTRNGSIGTT